MQSIRKTFIWLAVATLALVGAVGVFASNDGGPSIPDIELPSVAEERIGGDTDGAEVDEALQDEEDADSDSDVDEVLQEDDEEIVTQDEDDGGVPTDSPACEVVGCGTVETPDGLTKNLPQPAVDGINLAKEMREQAQQNGGGVPDGIQTGPPGGFPGGDEEDTEDEDEDEDE